MPNTSLYRKGDLTTSCFILYTYLLYIVANPSWQPHTLSTAVVNLYDNDTASPRNKSRFSARRPRYFLGSSVVQLHFPPIVHISGFVEAKKRKWHASAIIKEGQRSGLFLSSYPWEFLYPVGQEPPGHCYPGYSSGKIKTWHFYLYFEEEEKVCLKVTNLLWSIWEQTTQGCAGWAENWPSWIGKLSNISD